jgi:serine phosphatase RsbU (regulator of sigma subunit)
MRAVDTTAALRRARDSTSTAVPEILVGAAAPLDVTDLVLYLVDFGQVTLEPVPDRSTHAAVSAVEPVAGTMAGRAFTDQKVLTAEREDGIRVWIPVHEGSDRTGVLAITVPGPFDDDVQRACEDLGILAGHLITSQARCTDVFNLYRRRKAMCLAASMQWDLLPPLVLKAGPMAVAGLVEPAYDVGGDCFDYAANGPTFDFALMDAMGHGVRSSVLVGLAMGAYRHGRREARSLLDMHGSVAAAMEEQFPERSFVAGILARIATETGELTLTNAGHPLPLLIRGGSVVGEIACPPAAPWGLGIGTPTVASVALEPGDCVLLYTDGVTEARTPDGEMFGLDRLIDLTQNNASALAHPEEIVRRLVGSVLAHQASELRDDATVVLVRWDGPPA